MNVCKVASRIRLQRLEDRMVDNAFFRISPILYIAHSVRVRSDNGRYGGFFRIRNINRKKWSQKHNLQQ